MYAPSRSSALVALIALSLLVACPTFDRREFPSHTYPRQIRKTVDVRGIRAIEVRNLVGSVALVGGESDDTLEVTALLTGGAGDSAAAESLSERLGLSTRREGDLLLVEITYPVAQHAVYLDPQAARPGEDELDDEGERIAAEPLRWEGSEIRVVDELESDAVLLYADLRLALPPGIPVRTLQLVGDVDVQSLDAPLRVDLRRGQVHSRRGAAPLEIQLGQGLARVADRSGPVQIEARSAVIEVVRHAGTVRTRTASGFVRLREATGEWHEVETTGGGISLEEVSGSVTARSERGAIEGEYLEAGSMFVAESEEGGISLRGDFANAAEVLIGSRGGEVELVMTALPEMALVAVAEGGLLEVDVPDLRRTRDEPERVEGILGTPEATFRISSEEGSVLIKAAEPPRTGAS